MVQDIVLVKNSDKAVKIDYTVTKDSYKSDARVITFDDCLAIDDVNETTIIKTLLDAAKHTVTAKDLLVLADNADHLFYRLTKRFYTNVVITGSTKFVNEADTLNKKVIYNDALKSNEFLFLFNGSDCMSASGILLKKNENTYGLNITDYMIIKGTLK